MRLDPRRAGPVVRALVAVLLSFALVAAAAPVTAHEDDVDREASPRAYPAVDPGYHTYAEMQDAILALIAEHPDRITMFSYGTSYEGRTLWAVKISDNVLADEPEPEVLIQAGIHAREHITVEQALAVIRWLVTEYGRTARVTQIVDTREVWILPNTNPDGSEFDLGGETYRGWRKNRRPIPRTTAIGVDLNRNFSYRWGTGGVTSTKPSSGTYNGPHPFSEPESVALRDFVLGRRVNGRQQLRFALSLHAYGRQVIWPFMYTKTDVPPDMTAEDHLALVATARGLASRNRYAAKQASDMYEAHGVFGDWAYGDQRIHAFTFEMYPGYGGAGFYPPYSEVPGALQANRNAILWLLELASCPYASSGRARANCGPLYDDLESDRGWQSNPYGTDTPTATGTATTGAWERAIPQRTSLPDGRPLQPGRTASGQSALVTGAAAGSWRGANDVDGSVSVLSPPVHLPAARPAQLSFAWFLAWAGSSADDALRVSAVVGTQSPELLWEQHGAAGDRAAVWATQGVDVSRFAGRSIRFLVQAVDGGVLGPLEAGIDDVRVWQP